MCADRDDEQRRAVDEQLVGARDDCGCAGERRGAADAVGLACGPVERAAEAAPAGDERRDRTAEPGGRDRRARHRLRADEQERRRDDQPHAAVGEQHDRVAGEPARAPEDAADDVREPVGEHADDERRRERVARLEEPVRDRLPRDGERERERNRNGERDEDERAQDASRLHPTREPVCDRLRRRLLERPVDEDRDEEHRRPQDADLAVPVLAERARGEDEERVRESARRDRGERQERGSRRRADGRTAAPPEDGDGRSRRRHRTTTSTK